MSVLELARVERQAQSYDLASLFPDLTGPFTSASVTLLPKRTGGPGAGAVWTAATVVSGVATVLFSGPDADSSGAVAVTGDADVWVKTTVGQQTETVRAGRITLLGGGTFTLPASVQALIGLDTDGVPFYDPGGIGTPAGLALDVDGVPYFTP